MSVPSRPTATGIVGPASIAEIIPLDFDQLAEVRELAAVHGVTRRQMLSLILAAGLNLLARNAPDPIGGDA